MEKSKIEWCDSTWNPVSGCYHDCEYCYARKTANRFKGCIESPDGSSSLRLIHLDERRKAETENGVIRNAAYPYGFTPTFHEYRLSDPLKKGFGKTIFVCSMADLFGEWIPEVWITAVFDSCKKADNHRYLFLTKNPGRYYELAQRDLLPEKENFWYGTTVTEPDTNYFFSEKHNTFISVEPIQKPFDGHGSLITDWVIFGAETGNRKDKVIPERSWIENVVNICKESEIKVFMKDSMKPVWGEELITEFPWDDAEG